jgi:hypothetical protein
VNSAQPLVYQKPQVQVVDVLHAAIGQADNFFKTGNKVDSDGGGHYVP